MWKSNVNNNLTNDVHTLVSARTEFGSLLFKVLCIRSTRTVLFRRFLLDLSNSETWKYKQTKIQNFVYFDIDIHVDARKILKINILTISALLKFSARTCSHFEELALFLLCLMDSMNKCGSSFVHTILFLYFVCSLKTAMSKLLLVLQLVVPHKIHR